MSDNKVSVFSGEKFKGEWMPDRLVDAIEWMKAKLEEVPPTQRELATINIWAKPEETFQGIVNKMDIEYPITWSVGPDDSGGAGYRALRL